MDLGLRGRKAIVCASSQGLGKACALALAEASVSVVINGRNRELLQATAREIAEATEATVTPIELIQRVIDDMAAREFGRIVNITSASVKRPISGLDLSSGARAGLTAFLAGVARSVADRNVTITSLLPGSFDTARLSAGRAAAAKRRGIAESVILEEQRRSIPAQRFGQASELGQACAFLCSMHAGYITGQNIRMDGGAYPAAF